MTEADRVRLDITETRQLLAGRRGLRAAVSRALLWLALLLVRNVR
jgi:hypothetical protein